MPYIMSSFGRSDQALPRRRAWKLSWKPPANTTRTVISGDEVDKIQKRADDLARAVHRQP